MPFEVPWGLIRPLDIKGCIFPVCPCHIFCLSKEHLLPVGILKDAVCLGGQGGKGQALALAQVLCCSWVIAGELLTCASVSPKLQAAGSGQHGLGHG